MDKSWNPHIDNQTELSSAVIQGCLRFENSTLYNLTMISNLNFNFYLNRELIASKRGLQNKTSHVTDFYIEKNILYDLEVQLWKDSRV